MKKIFILGLLLTPIMANADPVGPSAVGQGQTAVVATASAPYATAAAAQGDTTNVVSASYVKGAYNDAIAAVNKVNNDKQAKLLNGSNNHNIESKVVAGSDVNDFVVNTLTSSNLSAQNYNITKSDIATDMGVQNMDDALISANIVLDGLYELNKSKQWKMSLFETGNDISQEVATGDYLNEINVSFTENNGLENVYDEMDDYGSGADTTLITTDGVLTLIKKAATEVQSNTDSKRVNALATWGSNTVTKVPLVNQ